MAVIYPGISARNPGFALAGIGEQRFTQRPKGVVMKLLFGVYLVGILATVAYFAVIGLTHH